jgi:purine nucleosidase
MPDALPVILDVDTGVDDAMAIALAVRSPGLELRAVTTVAGNVPVDKTTDNTRRVLAALGVSDVPVHRGCSRPLARPLHNASHIHGDTGLGSLELPPAPGESSPPYAPQFLVDTIMAAPGTIALICVGPLTNLAAAIALEPALPAALRRLVLMGGSLGRGNVTPYAEFNIYVDPEAAAQVCAACPLTMVGLDVTHQTNLTRAARTTLAAHDSAEARLVYGATAEGFDQRGWELFRLHDPLAVGVTVDPTLCTMKRGTLHVETATAWCAGQTTLHEEADGLHQVCTGVEAQRFLDLFTGTLGLPDLVAG